MDDQPTGEGSVPRDVQAGAQDVDASSPEPPSEATLDYARDLLESTREELVRADTKAALLFAASGIAIGALLNGLLGGRWAPFSLDNEVEWLWWVGVVSAVGALVCLASAIYPRTRRAGTKPTLVAYYGDVILLSRSDLVDAMSATPARINGALIDQIYQVSLIVHRKYRLIRIALWTFLAAAGSCTSAVLLNYAVQ